MTALVTKTCDLVVDVHLLVYVKHLNLPRPAGGNSNVDRYAVRIRSEKTPRSSFPERVYHRKERVQSDVCIDLKISK